MKTLKYFATIVAMLLCCITANAYDFEVDGIYYNITDKTTFTVGVTYKTTSYNSYSGNVVIPSTVIYNGQTYSVTSIERNAFCSCSGLFSITLPESLITIGRGAFSGSSSLTSITLPESVTKIYDTAFSGCSGLTSITLPTGLTSISYDVFHGCSSLTSITIPSGVTSIGSSAFEGCSSLTSIILPEGLTSIGGSAFKNCTSLTSITIPAGVTTIYESAFYGCSNLASITLPAGLTSIGNFTFYNCSGLTSVTIPSGITSIGTSAFYGCSSLASITIPTGLTSIGDYAFRNCSALASISLPDGMNSIGYGVFYDCSNLASVTMPKNLTNIAGSAFYNCTALSTITIPSGVTNIGSSAFYGCSSLPSVTIPNGVTSIESGTFAGCSSLTSVALPQYLARIGSSAFKDCSKITSITIPDGITSVESYTFNNCSSLTSIILPEKLTNIGSYAFNGCSSLTSITIPNGMTSIANNTFSGCSSLASITLPEKLTNVGNDAFNGCAKLTTVALPSGVTGIGSSAFRNCSSLTSITIPSGVTSIANYAFSGCSSLTSIVLPASLTGINSYTFQHCSGLTSITIPDGVKRIAYSAFYGCSSLTSLVIPGSVTNIENSAFTDCSKISELIIEDGSETLTLGSNSSNQGLFYDCPLENLYLGRNLSYNTASNYGYSPFRNQLKLATVSMGASVTSIGQSIFSKCSGLTTVALSENLTSIGVEAFLNCTNLTSINLPAKVTAIGYSAFWGCSSLAAITLPEGLNSIEKGTFKDCSSLTSINVPVGVTSIGESAFNGCSSLASITLPENLTAIGNYAFSNGVKEVILKPTTPPTLSSATITAENAVIVVPVEAYDDYCVATYWADLITKITIDDDELRVKNLTLTAAAEKSALHAAIGDDDLKFVTNLTISGSINSYDFMIMRNKMPLLRHLDLSNTSVVYNAYEHYTGYHSEDNQLPVYGLYNCKLITLTLPQSIKNIGASAIGKNIYLENVIIFNGVETVGQYAFSDCSSLTSITLPAGVKTIGDNAFSRCSKLKSVSLPVGLTTIASSAFSGCIQLSSITLPAGLTSIGYMAFYNCTNLISATLPTTLKTIDKQAFESCSQLQEIRIPSSVRTVGNGAFTKCYSLNDIYVYTVEPINIGQSTFPLSGNNFVGTLHAPKVSYWDYYYDTQWSQFTNFAEFDEPYDNFYLEDDKLLDENTGSIKGDGENHPDAEMGENSAIIVKDDVNQYLGDVDIMHDGENGGSIIVDGSGEVNADNLNFRITVTGGRWYFFCFPFDIRAEDIRCEGGAEWVFRYYDGAERANNGKGGWKNVTSDGNGNFLKAATGYIFQCSKNDVLVLSAKNGKIKKEDKYNELVEHITQNTHDASWNFVGNPYLSYYEVTSEDYSAPITVWDGSKYIAIRPGDDDYQLAPFEAFFVQKPNGKDKVNYKSEKQMTRRQATEAAAAASARRSRQAIDPNRLLVNLTLSNGEETDRTRVVFNNNAAMEYETDCDAAKFSTQGVPQIYTMDGKGVKYAINERPTAQGSVSLGYSVNAKGTYTIEAGRMDVAMCLMDNLTGTVHDLTKGGYEFSSEAGTFDKRFTLFIKGDATAIENVQGSEDDANGTIYNVKGQQVQKMEQGDVYIKDNRKVIK